MEQEQGAESKGQKTLRSLLSALCPLLPDALKLFSIIQYLCAFYDVS